MIPIAVSTGALRTEELLLKALLQLIVIIVAARLFATIFRKLGQPSVVGEIAAGLILGPSCLAMSAVPWNATAATSAPQAWPWCWS